MGSPLHRPKNPTFAALWKFCKLGSMRPFYETNCPRPADRAGHRAGRSVGVAAAGTGSDEASTVVLGFEVVGVDQSGEA